MSSGVFKTTNGGTSWTAINSGLPNLDVAAVVIDPSNPATLYAGTDAGVFKSINAGTSWMPTGSSTGGGSGPATTMTDISGNYQNGTHGQPLRYPFVVVVTNVEGIPVEGITVDFAVQAGGGALSATQVITDSQGVALTTLTLGQNTGINTVEAASTGLAGSPITFIANKKVRAQLTRGLALD